MQRCEQGWRCWTCRRRTVIFPTEDGPATLDNQLYMSVGSKDRSANATALAGNGLDNGELYVYRSLDPARNSERTFTSGSVTGEWVHIPNAETLTDTELVAASDALGAMTFVRPEDGAFNPNNPNEFFFVTTGSSQRSRRRRQRTRAAVLAAAAPMQPAQTGDAHHGLQRRHRRGRRRGHSHQPGQPGRQRPVPDDQRGLHHGEPGGHGRQGPRRLDLAIRPGQGSRRCGRGRRLDSNPNRPGRPTRSRWHPGRTRDLGSQRHHRRGCTFRRRHLALRRPGPPAHNPSRRPNRHRRRRPTLLTTSDGVRACRRSGCQLMRSSRRDLHVRQATGNEPQDLELACGETCDFGRNRPAGGSASKRRVASRPSRIP